MDENRFTYRGKLYQAHSNPTGSCSECAFEDIECVDRMIAKLIPECFHQTRKDCIQVMFKQID